MARVPTYEGRQINVPLAGTSPDIARGEGLADIGRGLVAFGAAVTQLERRKKKEEEIAVEKKARQDAAVYNAKMLSQLREQMTSEFTNLKNTSEGAAEGFTPSYLNKYDELTKQILEVAPNEYSREDLTVKFAEMRGMYADQGLTFEAAASQLQRQSNYIDGIRSAGNVLTTNPSQFEAILSEQMTALDAIRGDLPASDEKKLEWDTSNGLATAAIEGEIRLSPAVANKRLKSGYWDKYITPDQKIAYLKSSQSAIETHSALYQDDMERRVRNHLALLSTTGRGLPGVSRGQVAAVFGGGDRGEIAARKFDDQEHVAKRVYTARVQLDGIQTPEDRMDLVTSFAPSEGNISTYAIDQEVYEKVLAANQEDVALLQKDPAAWSQKNGSVQRIAENQGTVAAVNASLLFQERAGVSSNNTRVLRLDQVKENVARLNDQTPQDKIRTLDLFEREYGKHFPKVMSELMAGGLSPDYMVIHNINKTDPATATILAQGATLKTTDVSERFVASGRGSWATVETAVTGKLKNFEEATTYAYQGRRGEFNAVKDLYARTAGNLVLSGRFNSVQDAMDALFKPSIGQFHIERTYYLPQTTSEGKPIDQARIATELERVIRNPSWVSENDLVIDVTPGLDAIGSAKQKVDFQLIKSQGFWTNSADGQSLELWIDRGTFPSRVQQVRPGPKGRGRKYDPFTITLDDIADGKHRTGTPASQPKPSRYPWLPQESNGQ